MHTSPMFKKVLKFISGLTLQFLIISQGFSGVIPDAVLLVDNQSLETVALNEKRATGYDFFFTVPYKTARRFAFYQLPSLDSIDLSFPKDKGPQRIKLYNSSNDDDNPNQFCILIDKDKKVTAPKNYPIQIYGESDRQMTFSIHIESKCDDIVSIEVQESPDSRLAMTVLGRTDSDASNPAITVECDAFADINTFLITALILDRPYKLDLKRARDTDYSDLVFFLPIKEGRPSLASDKPYLRVEVARWGITSVNQTSDESGSFFAFEYNVILERVTQSQVNDVKSSQDLMDVDIWQPSVVKPSLPLRPQTPISSDPFDPKNSITIDPTKSSEMGDSEGLDLDQ